MALKNIIGQVFGHLKVVDRADNKPDGTARWKCVCSCGESRVIPGTALRAGRHKSCGCQSPKFTPEDGKSHGMSKCRVYKIWQGMIRRCSPKANGRARRHYFEKGIRVCERWLEFGNFYADMGEPREGWSIDRIDNKKGYSPENCRWASYKMQANNNSKNLLICANGATMTASEWSDVTGLNANTIVYRIRRGWEPERAINPEAKAITKMRKEARTVACLCCAATFIPRTTQLAQGRGKFCSQKCNGQYRKKVKP